MEQDSITASGKGIIMGESHKAANPFMTEKEALTPKIPYTYTFIGEWGKAVMPYSEFHNTPELYKAICDNKRYLLDLGLTLLSYPKDYLNANKSVKEQVEYMEGLKKEEPLSFFVPYGRGIDFLNDSTHDVKAIRAPNRVGKTTTFMIDILLSSVPCSANWPIFKQHGVNFREFRKQEIGLATYNWAMSKRVMWKIFKEWVPRKEIYDDKGNLKDIAWRIDPSTELTCGSNLYMFCYEQKQDPYESQVITLFGWDEQGDEPKFDGIDERLRTKNGRHVFGFTPHKVEGRPDTGARTWINNMLDGSVTKGHNIAVYTIGVNEVPCWIYSDDAKHKAYVKHVLEPHQKRNFKNIKEGEARFFGIPHDAAGLVFDEWNTKYHVVEPFQIPDTWTRYRGFDHGVNNPTAMVWLAVSPEGYVYIYREYYESGLTVSQNVENIIKASGNVREKIASNLMHQRAGMSYDRYNEKIVKERYHMTVGDSRSMGQTDALVQMNLQQLYAICGLKISPASGKEDARTVPFIKEFLSIDMDRKHPHNQVDGSPKMFVFRTCPNIIREMSGHANLDYTSSKIANIKNRKEQGMDKDNHTIDAIKYLLSLPPKYIADRWAFYDTNREHDVDEDEETLVVKRRRLVDSYTGY